MSCALLHRSGGTPFLSRQAAVGAGLWLLILGWGVLPAAGQATITVNTTADNTTAGDGDCTLREALTNANANSDTTSGDCIDGIGPTDMIVFSIGGGGSTATIEPGSALPAITEGVEIDGTTQGCGAGVPCIELDGTNAGAGVSGLAITGAGSTIRGLVINRFSFDGISIGGAAATGNVVEGNYIGTDVTGTVDLGNTLSGVLIVDFASSNTVGGTTAGAGNTIAFNGSSGVSVVGDASTQNMISRNAVFSNISLGIDLGGNGQTANDPGDPDTGPNKLQNFPEISGASFDGGTNTVSLTYFVDTDPTNATYPLTVEFFRADTGGEGEAFLGADSYTPADYNGCGTPPCAKNHGFTPSAPVTSTDEVVATATDADGNTSEFTINATQLPVELLSFMAEADGPAVTLRWTTASEKNNAGFEVESTSEGAEAWARIAFIEGHGTTTAPQRYEHRVADLLPGTHRFRLRQLDFDGAYEYSPTVEVRVGVPGTHLLQEVYPNPFRRQATLRLAVAKEQRVRIEVFNLLGRRVALLHEGTLAVGVTHPFVLDGSGLTSGPYVYRVEGEHFSRSGIVTLLK